VFSDIGSNDPFAWQYVVGIPLGALLGLAICGAVTKSRVPTWTYLGLVGLGAVAQIAGGAISEMRVFIAFLTVRGGGVDRHTRSVGAWCLAGLLFGAAGTLIALRARNGTGDGAAKPAVNGRQLGLVGVVLAFAAGESPAYDLSSGKAIVVWIAAGVTLGLAAVTFGTDPDRPGPPAPTVLVIAVAAAAASAIVSGIDEPAKVSPLLIGCAVCPLVVGSVLTTFDLVQGMQGESARQIAVWVIVGVAVIAAVEALAAVIVGVEALFGSASGGLGLFSAL
jgi:hypothetical protein